MLNNLNNWNSTFESISKENNKIDFLLPELIDKEASTLLTLESLSSETQIFTFNKETFKLGLSILTNYADNITPMNIIGNAWEQAILSSFWLILPGTFINPSPTPITTFSIVNPVIVDPTSLLLSKQSLINSLLLLNNQNNSIEFVKCFREAILMLEYTISGLNSLVPTPTPLLINSKVV